MSFPHKNICIHGHFYQPPRENPWLEEVELQDSAYPFHDWNARITAECYGPNAFARILDEDGNIVDIVSNYEYMSFNFGPTLLSWMERHAPEVYSHILEADRRSLKRFGGHGSAIAQVYNHMIMPLAGERDKRTQVEWGIRDFADRFGRDPEGMWLAETAVDTATLEVLAEYGISFTILSPYQALEVLPPGADRENPDAWNDASGGRVDPKRPYLFRLPSGRSITLFFYDGPVSQEVAFGGLLASGDAFAHRLLGLFSEPSAAHGHHGDHGRDEPPGSRDPNAGNGAHHGSGSGAETAASGEGVAQPAVPPELVHIATDGETYGHHHRYGEMALSYCLHHVQANDLARITVYGEFLEANPPAHEVRLVEPSSWSCAHGVERWRSDCGCNSGMKPGWTQAWREPLRGALDWLSSETASLYAEYSKPLLRDPWKARNEFGAVVINRSPETVEAFFRAHARRELSQEERSTVLRALEMQRHAMLMYTSCGWFFDEISGIETVQIMQYAARAVQLAYELAEKDLEGLFSTKLAEAPSNVRKLRDGAAVYERHVKPATVTLPRVASHYAVTSLFEEYDEPARIACFEIQNERYDYHEAGKHRLAVGRVRVTSLITEESERLTFAVLHLGDHNLIGGVNLVGASTRYRNLQERIRASFLDNNIPGTILLIDRVFGRNSYLLWHLFKDEQRKVLEQLLDLTYREVEVSYRRLFETNYSILQALKSAQMPIPEALAAPVRYVLNSDLRTVFGSDGPIDLTDLQHAVNEFDRWPFDPDPDTTSYTIAEKLTSMMRELERGPDNDEMLDNLVKVYELLEPLELELVLHEQQNIYFMLANRVGPQRFAAEPEKRRLQIAALGRHLRVRIPFIEQAAAPPEESEESL